jgi:hypothetical protein
MITHASSHLRIKLPSILSGARPLQHETGVNQRVGLLNPGREAWMRIHCLHRLLHAAVDAPLAHLLLEHTCAAACGRGCTTEVNRLASGMLHATDNTSWQV